MQKETCKKKNKKRKLSQVNSSINNRRNEINSISRDRQRKKRKSFAYVNFLTTNSLKDLSSLQIDNYGNKSLFKENITPEELIKSLYPIIKKDIDCFLHSKVFNKKTKPIEFLNWMLKCYEDVYPDVFWEIYQSHSNNSYHIRKVYDYNHGEGGHSVGINFMPILEKENKVLYKHMAGILKLLIKSFNIPTYWCNEELEYAIDVVECEIEECLGMPKDSQDKEEMERLEHFVNDYKGGNVISVQADILSSTFNQEKYLKFKPKNGKEKACKIFIDNALKLLEWTDVSFNDFVHTTSLESEEGMPVTPYEYCAIGWSYEEDDPIAWNMHQSIEMNWNEYGSIPFRYFSIDKDETEESSFPYDWIALLDDLNNVANKY